MLQKDTIKAENKLLQELLMISIKELDSTLKDNNNKEKNILRLKKIIKTINGKIRRFFCNMGRIISTMKGSGKNLF